MRRADQSRILSKPQWIISWEQRVAAVLPVHPHWLSAAKLVLLTPLMAVALGHAERLPAGPLWVMALFLAFALLDYLDGVVARARGRTSHFGRAFDRVTDYPMLVVLSTFCLDALPTALLLAKLGLDLLLLVLYLLGRGTTENRVRTTMSYATLLALLLLSQGWLSLLVSPALVTMLLSVNIAFSATVALHNLNLLHRRRLADLLTGANALCGVCAMVAAAQGRLDLSLLAVLGALAFDGLDGTAARHWGGSRRGVYLDDLADVVSFALAPAFAVAMALGGIAGATIGAALALSTISRLVFFTLNKDQAPAGFFQGAPSPLGAILVLSALNLWQQHPSLIGFAAGTACVLMVSFGTPYRHLGRLLARRPRLLLLVLPLAGVLLVVGVRLGAQLPATVLMAATLAYGLMPAARALSVAARAWATRRRQMPPLAAPAQVGARAPTCPG